MGRCLPLVRKGRLNNFQRLFNRYLITLITYEFTIWRAMKEMFGVGGVKILNVSQGKKFEAATLVFRDRRYNDLSIAIFQYYASSLTDYLK